MHKQAAPLPGPHRSDLVVTLAGPVCRPKLASTGEQKALLISILLAQAQLQQAVRGEPPLLLLDEIARASRSSRRRRALFEVVAELDGQALADRHRRGGVRAVAPRTAQSLSVADVQYKLHPCPTRTE